MKNCTIEEMVERVMQCLPEGVQKARVGVEKSIRVVLAELFAKMDLVTREEFDAQTKVLHRVESQLVQLEEKLRQYEDASDKNE